MKRQRKKSLFRPRKAGFRQTGSEYQGNRETGREIKNQNEKC